MNVFTKGYKTVFIDAFGPIEVLFGARRGHLRHRKGAYLERQVAMFLNFKHFVGRFGQLSEITGSRKFWAPLLTDTFLPAPVAWTDEASISST